MKFIFTLLATILFSSPVWAVDVQMGYDGNLVFEPAEISIAAGECQCILLIICFLLTMLW
jgi:plastocyanin